MRARYYPGFSHGMCTCTTRRLVPVTDTQRARSTIFMVSVTEVLHPSRDYIRYNMKHSILLEGTIGGTFVPRGQRLSIMMRVRFLFYSRIIGIY